MRIDFCSCKCIQAVHGAANAPLKQRPPFCRANPSEFVLVAPSHDRAHGWGAAGSVSQMLCELACNAFAICMPAQARVTASLPGVQLAGPRRRYTAPTTQQNANGMPNLASIGMGSHIIIRPHGPHTVGEKPMRIYVTIGEFDDFIIGALLINSKCKLQLSR